MDIATPNETPVADEIRAGFPRNRCTYSNATEHRTSRASVVRAALREAILSRRFPPGLRLKETQLACDLKVSRTPIREALRRLETEGLVVIFPSRGAVVANPGPVNSRDDIVFRRVLERAAAQLAAANPDKTIQAGLRRLLDAAGSCRDVSLASALCHDIDTALCAAASNRHLSAAMNLINELSPPLRPGYGLKPADPRVGLAQRIKIVELVLQRDWRSLDAIFNRCIQEEADAPVAIHADPA